MSRALGTFFLPFLWTTLTIYLGFQTTGPKWQCRAIVIHMTVNMATSPHQATSTKPAEDEDSRLAHLEPFVVFFFFISFFWDSTHLYLHLPLQLQLQNLHQHKHQQPMRKGPNNVRHVVWALCEFIYIYLYFINVLKVIYRYYLCTEKFNAGKNSDNGPKRRQMTWDASFGPWVSVFYYYSCFLYLLTI